MTRSVTLTVVIIALTLALSAASRVGTFDDHADAGVTPRAGSAEFDVAASEYRITGGGANIWGAADAFHYVWKRVSGDVTFTADVRFVGSGSAAHRKAALMVRQSLDPGAAYADVAVHGDGLTSLQFRPTAGAMTQEIRSTRKGPVRIRVERRGDLFMMFAGDPGQTLEPAGPALIPLQDPVYVGMAVCSHDANVLETALFSNVSLQVSPRQITRSKISIYDLKNKSVQIVFTADKVFEAPNWSPDGKYLIVNSEGSLWRLPLSEAGGSSPNKIDLGSLSGCNNDHGITRDGKLLAISARGAAGGSQVYLAAADGSNVRLMTPKSPSYFHTFSPDGRWFLFTGNRDGNFDLYRMSVDGGEEQRFTSHPALDDGPDYSKDGKWIYLNSNRTGDFDIWRIPAGGAGPDDKKAERVTSDEWNDWFPHPSPDGKWMVFVSFEKGTQGHPANKNVELRMMPMPGAKLKAAKIETLVKLFGGQGTINVNSWAPDSRRFAFVSYEVMPQ
jgi:TolB protein